MFFVAKSHFRFNSIVKPFIEDFYVTTLPKYLYFVTLRIKFEENKER